MGYQEKLLKLKSFIKEWDYLSEVLFGWDKVIKELTLIRENPNLDEEYVLKQLKICEEIIQDSIKLMERKQ